MQHRIAMFTCAGVLAFQASAQVADRPTDTSARNPDLPLVLIVPFPAGGSAERVGRLVATAMGEALHRNVTVRNITGGTGVSALKDVAKPAAGEIRLGYATNTQLIQGALLARPVAYNPSEDFEWVGVIGTFGNAMVVRESAQAATFDQWQSTVRTWGRPPRFGAGAPSSMGSLAARFLGSALGFPVEFVNFAGADEGYAALSAGTIDVYFDGLPNAMREAPKNGRRILAVTSRTRAMALPDVPAFGERWPGEDFSLFAALVVARTETEAIRARLKSGWYGVNRAGTAKLELQRIGVTYLGLDLESAPAFMESELVRHAKLYTRFPTPP